MGETCKKITRLNLGSKLNLNEVTDRQQKLAALLATARPAMLDLVCFTQGESLVILTDADGYVLQAEGTQAGVYSGRNWAINCGWNAFTHVLATGTANIKICSQECTFRTSREVSMAVPIQVEGRLRAVLGIWLENGEEYKFLFRFLKYVAKEIQQELAINKAYAELAAANTYLAAIAEISRYSAAGTDYQSTLENLIEKLAGIGGVRSAIILVPTVNGRELTAIALNTYDSPHFSLPLEGADSPLTSAYLQKRTIVHNGYEAIMATPMIVQGQVQGVIGVYQTEPHAFSQVTVAMFEAAAGLVGQIIENRKLHDQALREHNRLTQIMDQIDAVALLLLDNQGFIQEYNEAFQSWFAYLGLVVGQKISAVTDWQLANVESVGTTLQHIYFQAMTQEEPVIQEFVSQHAKERYFRIRVEPIIVKDKLDGSIFIITDITEQYQLEKAKAEILATISHELRTPITAIKGYLDLLEIVPVGALSLLEKDCLSSLRSEVQILSGLIEKVVTFNRFQLYKYRTRLEQLNLTELVKRNLQLFKGMAETKNICLVLEEQTDTDVWIWGDVWGIQEVLYNLIDNAVKFSRQRSLIKVRLSQGLDIGQLEIEDAGERIPVGEREKIFEQFYRGEGAAYNGVPGSGLGLFIVKHIIAQHGGRMIVEEGELGGNRFKVTLPSKGRNCNAECTGS